uniref:Uncharacterized protein n=1 Tax=Anguilla anguilla TaxID=7936 RepID=A0A0E9X2I0_ANGAN
MDKVLNHMVKGKRTSRLQSVLPQQAINTYTFLEAIGFSLAWCMLHKSENLWWWF